MAGISPAKLKKKRHLCTNVRAYIPFQKAGSTQGRLYTAVHNNHDGSNVPDAVQWQWIPRFNGSVYHYQVQYGGEHKGVNIQKVTTADLHEGDDVVYQHTYKKCQWKGVDLWTEGDTAQPAHSESSLDSDADCVLVASTGSNSEAKCTSTQSESMNGKVDIEEIWKIFNPPLKKGECTCMYTGFFIFWAIQD